METKIATSSSITRAFLAEICEQSRRNRRSGGTGASSRREGELPSAFAVSDFAAAAVGAAGLAALRTHLARCSAKRRRSRSTAGSPPRWFGMSVSPVGWSLPPSWDPIAGDYEASDGWIRLHTNAPHHRAAALDVLGVAADKAAVAAAVRGWTHGRARSGGRRRAAAARRRCASLAAWGRHPQGRAVAAEPVVATSVPAPAAPTTDWPRQDRPLRPAGARLHARARRAGRDALPRRLRRGGPAHRPAGLGRASASSRSDARQALRPARPQDARGPRALRGAPGRGGRVRPRLPPGRARPASASTARRAAPSGPASSTSRWTPTAGAARGPAGAASTASCR